MTYSVDSVLAPGEIVGDTGRMVLLCTQFRERVPGDTFAGWVAICHKKDEFHPFAVWDVFARPEGWHASSGEYFKTFNEAEQAYFARGGYKSAMEVF